MLHVKITGAGLDERIFMHNIWEATGQDLKEKKETKIQKKKTKLHHSFNISCTIVFPRDGVGGILVRSTGA